VTAMKACERLELQFHRFLTSPLDRGECLTRRPAVLPEAKQHPLTIEEEVG